jgi:hypothetical protein
MLEKSPMLEKSLTDARKLILNQIKIGQAIRSQRIEYVDDLEEARSEKQEWVSRTTELLRQLFADGSIADGFNDYVGPILPEYAEWNLFVEQFNNEMKHRLGRLSELLNQLSEAPESPSATTPAVRNDMTSTTPAPTTPAIAKSPSRREPIILLMPRAIDEKSLGPIREFLEQLNLPSHPIELALDAPGGWQLSLARQLKSAGVAVDLNRLI